MSEAPGQSIVYFSKMVQAIPAMAPALRVTGGCFVSNRPQTLAAWRQSYPELPSLGYWRHLPWLCRSHRLLRRARVIVSGARHGNCLDRYPGKRALVFQGTLRLLPPEVMAILPSFDHVFFNSPRQERVYLRHADEYPVSYSVAGYLPMADFPRPDAAQRVDWLRRLGLDPEAKTILYAPARRESGSWNACAEAIATEVPADMNLVLRPHPSQVYGGTPEEKALFGRLQELAARRGRLALESNAITWAQLLSVADLLISDATSPTEEFLYYDRPQIIPPTYGASQWQDVWQREGVHEEDIADLLKLYDCALCIPEERGGWAAAVAHLLTYPEERQAERQCYFSWAFGVDPATAPQRVASVLRRLAEDAP